MHGDKSQHQEFVASFTTQFWQVLIRTWKHFWSRPLPKAYKKHQSLVLGAAAMTTTEATVTANDDVIHRGTVIATVTATQSAAIVPVSAVVGMLMEM